MTDLTTENIPGTTLKVIHSDRPSGPGSSNSRSTVIPTTDHVKDVLQEYLDVHTLVHCSKVHQFGLGECYITQVPSLVVLYDKQEIIHLQLPSTLVLSVESRVTKRKITYSAIMQLYFHSVGEILSKGWGPGSSESESVNPKTLSCNASKVADVACSGEHQIVKSVVATATRE